MAKIVPAEMIADTAPQRPEAYADAGIRACTESMGHVNDYVLIRTTANDRLSQVETGMVLQAVWMDLIRTGHVVQANSQALQEYPAYTPGLSISVILLAPAVAGADQNTRELVFDT